ncbi:ABC transporter substrate-binding protein [Roseomonas xinghualingensis]|uniref:ABC transporter substrate-binding protein n=1 Tax=Roseomonas xinghualingensis TaxID=2986475 RepID=UPI0021F0CD15|nr:ABC transporter substrate-binding protein [Roseomonas sp. SXEYE001]MCV4206670.1 ABC transporter substrate-binding protein [Roseomonas sp. SXEYE001]
MDDQGLKLAVPTRRSLLAGAILATGAAPALAQTSPAEVVGRFHAALIQVMRDARRLGVRGRYERLRPVMEAAFDLPAMTRIAVGPPWNRMTPDQQAQLTQAFSEWSIASYAKNFDGYSGESFVTTGTTPLQNGDQMVRTVLNRPNDAPLQLNYLMRRMANGGWRIVDVYLTGSISELASRRSDFAAILREGGADRLTAELRRRTAELLRS